MKKIMVFAFLASAGYSAFYIFHTEGSKAAAATVLSVSVLLSFGALIYIAEHFKEN